MPAHSDAYSATPPVSASTSPASRAPAAAPRASAAPRTPAPASTPNSTPQTPNPSAPSAERRLKDAPAARALWRRLRAASERRRELWAQVQNQLDGAPPFANADLVASGQGWRCNVNFRDAASTLEQVLVSYWRLLHDTTTLAAVTVLGEGDPHAERHEQVFQTNFNRFVDDWGADYVRNYLLLSLNHVAFGVGVGFFNDRWSPRWEAVRVGELEIPAKAKASVEKLAVVGVRQEMEVDALWDLVRTDEKKRIARQRGWNVSEIEKLLANTLCDRPGDRATPTTADDLLELGRLLRDNSLGVSTGHEPLKLVHLLLRDYDGRITRLVFAEALDHNDAFLFDDSAAPDRPESMTHLLGAVFFDAGNGDWWGTKGFGVKNFQTSTVLNRLKSRAVDRTLIDGLTFRDLSEGSRETVPITNVGPFNFLPKDVEQVPNYPTGRSILETIDMVQSDQAFANARYRDTSRQIAQSGTATQASLLANLQSQVDVANATLYLRQVARSLFAEQFRRLRLRGSLDPDARLFRQRCIDESGMPESVFYDGEISIRTGADPGASNLALQGARALEGLMALPEANKRWLQEKWVAANFGAQAVRKALHAPDAAIDIRAGRLALMENSDMGEGNPLPVDARDNHPAHIPAHLQPLEVIVHNYQSTGRLDPNALVALQFAIPHLAAHFEYLKQDRTAEPLYRETAPRFAAVESIARGMFAEVQRMHNQAAQQQAAQQQFAQPQSASGPPAGAAAAFADAAGEGGAPQRPAAPPL